MQNDILTSLTRLSDAELVARVKSLVARERDATAHLVAHLAELDTRDVHLRAGYESLYVYCRDALGLSEGESYNRIEVARGPAVSRHPRDARGGIGQPDCGEAPRTAPDSGQSPRGGRARRTRERATPRPR